MKFSAARRRFKKAFVNALGVRSASTGPCIVWMNRDGKPQVLEMVDYQHGRGVRASPVFFRAAVNFRPPPREVPRFWRERDEIDQLGPNANIEITVALDEAEALARWLPAWLRSRDGEKVRAGPPPEGLEDIVRWHPELQHVYIWSSRADAEYRIWEEARLCPQL